MSAFDATIRVGEASVQPVEEDGKVYEAQMILGVVGLIPVSPTQAAPLPLGALRVPMNKDTVRGMRDQLSAVLEEMQDRPNIAVAQNLNGIDQAVQAADSLR